MKIKMTVVAAAIVCVNAAFGAPKAALQEWSFSAKTGENAIGVTLTPVENRSVLLDVYMEEADKSTLLGNRLPSFKNLQKPSGRRPTTAADRRGRDVMKRDVNDKTL